MRYGGGCEITDKYIRAAVLSPGELPKRRRWNWRRAVENLAISLATGAVVVVLSWIFVVWLTGW